MENKFNLLAVVSTGRSGSTLLPRVLDSSPNIWSHPQEVIYLSLFDDLASGLESPRLSTRFNARISKLKTYNIKIGYFRTWPGQDSQKKKEE